MEARLVADGLLLTPKRKARANWEKAFRRGRLRLDDIAPMRQVANAFDRTDWRW
jgi:hypothetical protein